MTVIELVNKAEAGDNQAIAELYQLTSKQAYSLAMQITKNEEESFDILQDSYLKAFDNLSSLKDKSKFTSWFYQILANKCRDFLKSKRNTNVLFSDMTYETDNGEQEVEFIDENSTFSPEENTDYNETKRLLAEMIDNLPDEQKLVVLMHYMQDLSIKEIAQSLEVSENTVKSRLNYAKKKIKVQVEDLEKKGTKLYGITGLSLFGFIIWMLKGGAEATAVPAFAEVVATKATAVASTAAQGATKGILTKVIAGAVAVTIASTAIGVGVVVASNNNNSRKDSNTSVVSEERSEEATESGRAIPLLDYIVNGDSFKGRYYQINGSVNNSISFEVSDFNISDGDISIYHSNGSLSFKNWTTQEEYGPIELNIDYGTATQGKLKDGDIVTLSVDNADLGDAGFYFTETEKEIRIEGQDGITREQAQENFLWFSREADNHSPQNSRREIGSPCKVIFLESNNVNSKYSNRVLVAFADSLLVSGEIIHAEPVFFNNCYYDSENGRIKYESFSDTSTSLPEKGIDEYIYGKKDTLQLVELCFSHSDTFGTAHPETEDSAEYYNITQLTETYD